MPSKKSNSVAPIGSRVKFGEDVPNTVAVGGNQIDNKQQSEYASARGNQAGKMFLIHPEDRRKVNWDLWLALLIVYSTITVPYRIAFEAEATGIWFGIDIMVDIFFWLDMFLTFRTSFCNEDGEYTWDRKVIARHYLKSWFVIDFTSTLPIDTIAGAAMGGGGEASTLRAVKLIRVVRLVRLLKLVKLLNISEVLEANEDFIPINPGMLSIVSMLVKIVFLAHLLACFWFMVGQGNDESGWINGYFGYTDKDPSVAGGDFCTVGSTCNADYNSTVCEPVAYSLSFQHNYTVSLYWAITTMATVGYGDLNTSNDIERGYSVLVMLLGGSVFGYTVGMISQLAAGLDVRGSKLGKKMEDLKNYMLDKELQADMQKRLRRHWNYYYRSKSVFDEGCIMSDMTDALKADMVELKHGSINELRVQVPKFLGEDREAGFLSTIVPLLKPLYAMVGEALFQQGNVGWHMYWITEGKVTLQVFTGGESGPTASLNGECEHGCQEKCLCKQCNTTVMVRSRGDGFGENFVLTDDGSGDGGGGTSPCTAVAHKYTELISISHEDLVKSEILDNYSEFEDQLREESAHQCKVCTAAVPTHVPPTPNTSSPTMVQVLTRRLSGSNLIATKEEGSTAGTAVERESIASQGSDISSALQDDDDDHELNPTPAELWSKHRLIHPEHNLKVYWDLLVGGLIIYSVIVVPLRLSFAIEAEGASAIADIVMDLIFGLDMVVSVLTAYFNERCELVYNGAMIRKHYLKGWFLIDFPSTFPFDRVATLFVSTDDDPCAGGDGFFRVLKILRVARLFRLAKLIKLLKNGPLYEKFEDATANMHAAVFSVPALFIILLFSAHLIGCVWYAAAFEDFNTCDPNAAAASDEKLRRLLGNAVRAPQHYSPDSPETHEYLPAVGGPVGGAVYDVGGSRLSFGSAVAAVVMANDSSSSSSSSDIFFSGSSFSSSSSFSGSSSTTSSRLLGSRADAAGKGNLQTKQDGSWLCAYEFGAPCACDDSEMTGQISVGKRYLLSFYWALTTMTTVGYGDIAAHAMSRTELAVAMISMLLGTSIFAFVIGEVLMVVLHFDPSATLLKEAKGRLKAYIVAEKNLGTKLKHVIRRNLAYQVKVESVFDTKAIFDTMPEFLFHQMQSVNHIDTWQRHRLFSDWNGDLRGCMSLLMSILQPLAIIKDQIVCKAGMRGLVMYWVEKGRCRATKPTLGSGGNRVVSYNGSDNGSNGSKNDDSSDAGDDDSSSNSNSNSNSKDNKGEESGAFEDFEAGEHFGQECLFVPAKTRCRMTRTVRTRSSFVNLLALKRTDFVERLQHVCPLLWARVRSDLDPISGKASALPGGSWVEIVQPATATAEQLRM